MDILQVLQTVGICVGALALVAIAVMLFFVFVSFVPSPDDVEVDNSNLIEVIQARMDDRPQPRRSTRKKTPPKS